MASLGADVFWTADNMRDVALSPNGDIVAVVGSVATAIQIWRPASNQRRSPIELEIGKTVIACAISSKKQLAVWCADGTVQFWNLQPVGNQEDWSEELQRSLKLASPRIQIEAAPAVKGGIVSVGGAFTYSPDGQFLALAGKDGVVAFVDVESLVTVELVASSSDIMDLDFDGKELVSQSRDGEVRKWDYAARRSEAIAKTSPQNESVCADFGLLAIGPGPLRILDLTTGVEIASLDMGKELFGDRRFLDAETLVTACGDGSIRFWDIANQRQRFHIPAHSGLIGHLEVSLDGRMIVSGSFDGAVRLWRAPQQQGGK